MALTYLSLTLVLIVAVCGTPRRGKQSSAGPTTCPGYPGYCSESYPGQTCLVVCARGRNNVPECQEDGTWTDEPRCIEHEPGKQSQVPGVCPGIPGYCSLDTPGGLCTFQCSLGPAIRSTCTPDGTWAPYPTCEGDPRETQDGCDPCPGPLGGFRNRTAEAAGGGGGGARSTSKSSGISNNVRTNGASNKKNNAGNRNNAGSRNNSANRNNAGNRNNSANRNNSGNRNNAGNRNRNNGGNKNAGNRNSGGNKNAGNRNNSGNRNSSGGNKNNRNQQRPSPAQQPRSSGGFKTKPVQSSSAASRRSGSGGSTTSNALSCPGSVLQACIDVCPGFSPRVFSACVSGCAKRCPGKK